MSSGSSSQPIKKEDLHKIHTESSTYHTNSNNNNNSSSSPPAYDTENLVQILEGVKTMHEKQSDVVNRLEYLKRFSFLVHICLRECFGSHVETIFAVP